MSSVSLTVSGVDANTDLDLLPECVEIAILYTKTPEGRHRYPSRRQIARMLRWRPWKDNALHVCGRGAREQLLGYQIPDLTHLVQRIQVNGEPTPEEVELLCEMYSDHEIITQHTHRNVDLLSVRSPNHSLLVDSSGGRGLSPDRWEMPDTKKRVGFAGGLGPGNIAEELKKILKVSGEKAWVDMEGKLRDKNDWFDVHLADAVVDAMYEWLY